MDWPQGGGPANPAVSLEYADVQDLAERTGAVPLRDFASDSWTFTYVDKGVSHEVWYPDAGTVARRVRLARDRGLGVGFWRLGREDQRLWSDPALTSTG
jgi:spore germination protein YaaH